MNNYKKLSLNFCPPLQFSVILQKFLFQEAAKFINPQKLLLLKILSLYGIHNKYHACIYFKVEKVHSIMVFQPAGIAKVVPLGEHHRTPLLCCSVRVVHIK